MTIWVVGAEGFLGKHLSSYFFQNSLKFKYSSRKLDQGDHYLDLVDSDSIESFPLYEGDVVVFLAGISSPEICENQPLLAKSVNFDGSSQFIEAAIKKGARVLFASTDAVYGNQTGRLSEDAPCFPAGKYAEFKNGLERKFSHTPEFKSLRFSFILASNDKFTSLLREKSSPPETVDVYSNFKRNAVNLSDVLIGITTLVLNWDAAMGNSIINFSGSSCLGRDQIALEICEKYGFKAKLNPTVGPDNFFEIRPKIIYTSNDLFKILLEESSLPHYLTN